VGNCAGSEKAFYQRLIETGGHEELLRSIRVLFSKEDMQKTFTLQEKDDVKDFADVYRKTLGFDKTFGEGTQSRRLLIFHPQTVSWPGSQYFTIILVNARYDVLSWRTAGGEPIMTGAELAADAKDWKLTITFRQRRSPNPLYATYRVSGDRIDLYENPEIDPPHQEKTASGKVNEQNNSNPERGCSLQRTEPMPRSLSAVHLVFATKQRQPFFRCLGLTATPFGVGDRYLTLPRVARSLDGAIE
jgi:hypothetical protein